MKNKIGSVHKRGKKGIYVAEWMYQGKRFNRSCHTTNKAEAEKMLADLTRPFVLQEESAVFEAIAQKVKGRPTPVCPIMEAPAKVKELQGNDITSGTWDLYSAAWDQLINYVCEHHKEVNDVADVTEEIADGFLSDLEKTGMGNGTINHKRSTLSKSWKLLKAPVNVWTTTRKRREAHTTKETFDPDEIKKLLAESSGTVRKLFVVAYHTGMRLSDCCAFDWKDIDWNRGSNGIIHLVPMKTKKNGQEIQVPISDDFLAELKSWGVKKAGPVCGAKYRRYIDEQANREIRRILFDVGGHAKVKHLPKKSFHSFRHTFISDLGNKGVPLQMVRLMVGHMSEDMTQKYFHAQDDALDSFMRIRKENP